MPEETSTNASLKALTEYVVARHHAYLRRELPRIAELFQSAQTDASGHSEALSEAANIFTTVQQKITVHLQDEEQILFPIGVCLSGGGTAVDCQLDLKARLEEMEREHDSAGNALKKCRDLVTVAAGGDSRFDGLLKALTLLIDDLEEHVRIENQQIHPLLARYL